MPTYEIVHRTDSAEVLQEAMQAGTLDVVTFTSASTVRAFLEAVDNVDCTRFTALCIGEQTAKQARACGMSVRIAENATIDSMIACLLEGNENAS